MLEFVRQNSNWTSTELRKVAFSDDSRLRLHRTDGRSVYDVKPLKTNTMQLLPRVQAGDESIMDDGIYQLYNVKCHTVDSVCAWFEEQHDEFTFLSWPANSSGLNPIENLWYHLDRVVRCMDPNPRILAQRAMEL
ncbi:transposable element Tcb1 transposase [Trichonephila clavipes]|nr:transposable element Tcb1 transposase [Trichonephila clavipes]